MTPTTASSTDAHTAGWKTTKAGRFASCVVSPTECGRQRMMTTGSMICPTSKLCGFARTSVWLDRGNDMKTMKLDGYADMQQRHKWNS